MKKFLLGFILGAFLFSILPIYAATQTAINVTYSNIKLSVRGVIVPTNEEPFIYNNRTFIPARIVAEALGMDVKYNEVTDTVEITDKVVEPVASKTMLNATSESNIPAKPDVVLGEGMELIWYEYNGEGSWCIKYNNYLYMNTFYAERALGYKCKSRITGTFRDNTYRNETYLILGNKEIVWDRKNTIQTLSISSLGLYINFTWLSESLVN
ncbi:MAG: copper amine oxidase N-terminal domain-containing protein [Gammaproteobacteria bacterium]|nr:copper amine oxidase N-terminal domain-containing protein [Gammaproteobacteria bacterium]